MSENRVAKTCVDCMYANEVEGGYDCDKTFLLRGNMVHIEEVNVHLHCNSHSDIPMLETRYNRNNLYIQDAEDACAVCGRLVDMFKPDTYDYYGGDLIRCKICEEKGRE